MDFITKDITYFTKPGDHNTDKTIELAVEYAKQNNIKKIVVATFSGETALKLKEKTDLSIIAVTLGAGTSFQDRRKAWESNLETLKSKGIICYRGTQALSGVSRGMHKRYGGVFPIMIFVDALKLFSEGVKVCVEISLMAADAGLISPDEDVVVIAGTGGGCDTSLLIQPTYTSSIYNLGIKEIICMPLQVGVLHDPR